MKTKLPYTELEFTKSGTIHKPAKADAMLQWIKDERLSDLIIISHGWNNDMKEARKLYKDLIGFLVKELDQLPGGRKFGVLGVLWPSKRFTDDELKAGHPAAASLMKVSEKKKLLDRLKELEDSFDAPDSIKIMKEAQKAAKVLDFQNTQAANDFVKQMNALIKSIAAEKGEPEDAAASLLKKQNAKPLLVRLNKVDQEDLPKINGGVATVPLNVGRGSKGGAAGLIPVKAIVDGAKGLFHGARNLLNFVTYYQMKERAGKVGELGLKQIIERVKAKNPSMKVHLIGHSFGARLVTTAAATLENSSVNTLVLLQAAFSHYGFAENYTEGKDGLFRRAITNKKVTGPVIISHTHKDLAVGKAYAVASRIARQAGEFIGGPTDLYGGLGANGAQITPEAIDSFKLDSGTTYNFRNGVIYNLNADNCIGGHSEICNAEVARAVAKAIS
jgi:hypothetical protein